ncbi:Na+/H+ antiporter subunit E [Alkalihalobacillus sp. BA299]|uniref:Na+/H+ antiporter subunit E n=1 Tax=Alkalihalobacillus sp. BA299 TaxID=2815938 RepID=UPI001ADD1FA4|nr:Na+/H+ antiporter subunit E [Alkalihalobacillus sp. BA299]
MPFQIIINLVIAFIWMFLKNDWTSVTFVLGYLLGLVLLFILRRFLPGRFYLWSILAIVRLFLIFMRELVLSNVQVIKQIISPRLDIQPGIFAYPTELKSDWEITTLACLITLTPGTLVVDISDDNKVLYVHAMDLENSKEVIKQIQDTFEKAIMEVTR